MGEELSQPIKYTNQIIKSISLILKAKILDKYGILPGLA